MKHVFSDLCMEVLPGDLCSSFVYVQMNVLELVGIFRNVDLYVYDLHTINFGKLIECVINLKVLDGIHAIRCHGY